MYKQTEEKYKKIMLGFGKGSIYNFGCYLVSLVNGLEKKGYSYTPELLNDLLKKNNGFVGETKNYINVDALDNIFPEIFKGFKRIEPFRDVELKALIEAGKIVVAKVSAIPLGGKAGDTHFVLVTGFQGNVARIYDPWFGDEHLVTFRYSKFGNLLGLRVFDIIPKNDVVKTVGLFEDIPTWAEDELNLKSYAWYDRNSSISFIVKQTESFFQEQKKNDEYEDKIKVLELEKIELHRKIENAKEISDYSLGELFNALIARAKNNNG